ALFRLVFEIYAVRNVNYLFGRKNSLQMQLNGGRNRDCFRQISQSKSVKRLHREKNVARENKFRLFRQTADETRRDVVAPEMRVDDFDIVFANETGDFLRAENAERISYGNVKNPVFRQKTEPVLPFVRRSKRKINFVPALCQLAR